MVDKFVSWDKDPICCTAIQLLLFQPTGVIVPSMLSVHSVWSGAATNTRERSWGNRDFHRSSMVNTAVVCETDVTFNTTATTTSKVEVFSLYSDHRSCTVHPLCKMMRMIACFISGNCHLSREFRLKQRTLFSQLGYRAHRDNIICLPLKMVFVLWQKRY